MPDWIKRARRGTDRGMLIVLILSLLSAWTFILNNGLPRNNASENYVFQTTDVSTAFQEGRFYPRWSPHAQQGYGAPILHYYPPGAPYAAALLDVGLTGDTVLAVRLLYGLSLMLSGVMVYALVLQYDDALSGLLAALLYGLSPFIGLTMPQIMGDLAGTLAAGLLPGFLWAFSRMLRRYHIADIAFVALFAAALIYTDPRQLIPALLMSGMMALHYLRHQGTIRHILLSSSAILAGLLMATPYWLPALLEFDAVHWRPPENTWLTASHTILDMLRPAQPIDPAALLPQIQVSIGLPLIFSVIIATLLILRKREKHYLFQQLMLVSGTGFLTFLTLTGEGYLWLLPAMLLSFAIAGSGVIKVRDIFSGIRQRMVTMSILIAATLLAMPVWLSSNPGTGVQNTDAQAQIRHEQQGFGIASLPPYRALPTTLDDSLSPNRFLIEGYLTRNINRFSVDNVLQNRASTIVESSHAHSIQIDRLPRASTITLLVASFPGWQATLNDNPVPLSTDSSGLLEVSLPVIERIIIDEDSPESFDATLRGNELQLSLGSTAPRQAAWFLFVCGILLLILLIRRRWYTQGELPFHDLQLLSHEDSRLITLVFFFLAIGTVFFNTDTGDNRLDISPYYQLRGSDALRYRTDAGLEAFAYRLPQSEVQAGNPLDLTLYWQAGRFLSENYQLRLHLRDVNTGQIRYSTSVRHPGLYPTRRWRRNYYVRDPHTLLIPENLTPGRYAIVMEVSDCNPTCGAGDRLQFFDENGRDTGTFPTLPVLIEVTSE
ncbi:MAG: 6-pyruvoyl-tetrahydropterin synthase-related protein [Aggregatilineales bacterium]